MRASDLPVCPKCGWHALMFHADECWPQAGKAADRLSARLKEIPSTKLGYGGHKLTFNFDEHHSLTLRVGQDGGFSVEKLFWLGRFDDATAEQLTRALAAIANAPTIDE
jgi:hypothetical protein